MEYEIPKYDGDLGQPNLFVPLEKETYQQKVKCLIDGFPVSARTMVRAGNIFGFNAFAGMECVAPAATQRLSIAANWCCDLNVTAATLNATMAISCHSL